MAGAVGPAPPKGAVDDADEGQGMAGEAAPFRQELNADIFFLKFIASFLDPA